jgi:hypothetical protein
MTMTMTKVKMTTDKLDALWISLLSTVSLALVIANVALHVPFTIMSLPLIGIIAYRACIRLGDYDIHINCDYIPSGEAAVGSFALFAALAFIAARPCVAVLVVFIALLAYELYLRAAIAPDRKELAVNGAAAQAILIVIAGFIITGGAEPGSGDPRLLLFGRTPSLEDALLPPIGALLLAALIFLITWVFKAELLLFSHGPAFSKYGAPARIVISAALIAVRSALLAITIFFAGWMCGIGFSVQRLYRGRLADAVTLLSLICFWQATALLDKVAGPWFALALTYIASYALFALHFKKRVYLYDRHQQS